MNSGKKEKVIGHAWDVFIGSTHVANPEDFLKQVKYLTGKVAPSDQHQFENQT